MNILSISILVLLSIVLIILLTSVVRLNAFVSLFTVALLAVITLRDRMLWNSKTNWQYNGIHWLLDHLRMIAVVSKTEVRKHCEYILSKRNTKSCFSNGTDLYCRMPIFVIPVYHSKRIGEVFQHEGQSGIALVAFVTTSLYSVHCLIPTHPGALPPPGSWGANIGYLVPCTLAVIPMLWQHSGGSDGERQKQTVEVVEKKHDKSVHLTMCSPPVFLSFYPSYCLYC